MLVKLLRQAKKTVTCAFVQAMEMYSKVVYINLIVLLAIIFVFPIFIPLCYSEERFERKLVLF